MATIADTGKFVVVGEAPRLAFARMVTRSLMGRLVLVAAGSTAIGIVFALPMWATQWRRAVPGWGVWVFVAPFRAAPAPRLPFTGKQLGRRAAAAVLGTVVFTSLYVYVFSALRAAWGSGPGNRLYPKAMVSWE